LYWLNNRKNLKVKMLNLYYIYIKESWGYGGLERGGGIRWVCYLACTNLGFRGVVGEVHVWVHG